MKKESDVQSLYLISSRVMGESGAVIESRYGIVRFCKFRYNTISFFCEY